MTGKQFSVPAGGTSQALKIHTGFLWRITKWLILLNVLVLIASGIVYDLLASPGRLSGILSTQTGIFVLSQFNLTSENTLATGYSSMLFLLTAAVAIICFLRTINSEKKGWGWLIIAGFFALVSLDEMGSLHENAGKLTSLDMMGTSTWESVLSLPLLIAIGCVMFGVVREVRWRTSPFWMMTAGALLFLTVPVHEYRETLMWQSHDSDWVRPVLPGLIEEGTELFAALLFFAGMVLWMLREGEALSRSAFEITVAPKSIRILIAAGSIAMLSGLFIMHLLSDTLNADDGIAANWFPAAVAMLIFIVTRSLKPGNNPAVLIYSVVLAGYFVCDFYSILHWDEIAGFSWVVRIVMTAGLVWFIFNVSLPFQNFLWRMGCIAAGMMISTAFVFEHSAVTSAATAGLLIILSFQMKSSMEFE